MHLIALCCLLLQDTAPANPPATPAATERTWSPLNSIRLIVNEEAVTRQDFARELQRRDRPVTTQAELDSALAEVGSEIVSRLLTIQAGVDLGFDSELIDRLVRDDMDATVERLGSVRKLGETLDQMDMDPQMLREDRRDSIYRRLWEGAVEGRSAGPGGRPHVDRYVRPSRLQLEYRRSDPAKLVKSMITLEELVIPIRLHGDAQTARDHALALHARLLAGEDFETLAQAEEDASPQRGSYVAWEPSELAAVQASPLFADFAREPAVGKFSEPLPVRNLGELQSFVLLRISALEIPDEPRFSSGAIQQILRTRIETRSANYRRDRALRALLDAAFVWPPEAFGRAKAEPDAVDG